MLTGNDLTFLEPARLGMFSAAVPPGWTRPVPVWFEAFSGGVRLFSGATSPKVARLRAHPQASLLVANNVGEVERWISIAGAVEFGTADAAWLEALTARYWDLDDARLRGQLDGWLDALDSMLLITVRADDVRRYGL